ncbi:hypothetical protein [Edaphobacter modestus]|uniref:Uncharacterized protein n=1 Tax=Edaphobacter modestus TaxID=388466 RepID=A0A4V2G497_9BACT|nr:hypothetical protein [Edaphobacter modestus]RZU40036.1 hypothetical protein BDD14_1453 [Edaphobacter modestus]
MRTMRRWGTVAGDGARAVGWLVRVCVLLVCGLGGPVAWGDVAQGQYQMPMKAAPTSVAEAIATLPDRQDAVITAMACGMELDFVSLFQGSANNEDIAAEVLGKLAWIQRHRQQVTSTTSHMDVCEFTSDITPGQICKWFDAKCASGDDTVRAAAEKDFLTKPVWTALATFTLPLRVEMIVRLPPECRDTGTQEIRILPKPRVGAPEGTAGLTFQITEKCLVAEVDAALLRIERQAKQVGTNGLPCNYWTGGTTEGDWDSTLKVLIRVAELDRRVPVLSDEARKKLNDRLIDIDGGPAQERYHLWECGNEEQSVGDPQERSDDRDGVDGFLDDLGGIAEDFGWILLLLLLVYFLFFVVPFFAAMMGGGPAAAAAVLSGVAGLVAVAAVGSLFFTIPESENHLWMINSTKYLNNQYLITHGSTGYSGDQADLREWILKELQRISQHDFIEYNSRPYARYTMVSIGNLAEFATDPDIQTGARAILEYSIAKYAVTSSEGRRLAPYRRKREAMEYVDAVWRDKSKGSPTNGLFDLILGSDHLHAVGLYFFGDSLNLPSFAGNPYAATTAGYPAQAIYYATSGYRPDEATYSLAMERTTALVHQRIHHSGWEIVSSGESFTITAGGHTTGIAKNATVDFIDEMFKKDDLGAAVPTTLMLAGAPDIKPGFGNDKPAIPRAEETRRSTLDRFLRFEGRRPVMEPTDASYDHNLCVWDGFACGVNLVIPADMGTPCMIFDARSNWYFIRSDSDACPGYKAGPVFWMALYFKRGPAIDVSDWGSVDSFGFFEIVDGSTMSFEEFRSRVLARNPGPGEPMHLSGGCAGVYVSARGSPGQRIEFSCEQVDKVDSVVQPAREDWTFAGSAPGALGVAPIQSSGNAVPIQSGGNGVIEITSAAAKRKVKLDFQRWDDPRFDTAVLP